MTTDWKSLEQSLSHADNDKRIQALDSLKVLLEEHDESTRLAEPEHLANVLKSSLRSNNSHVSNATLAVLPRYFSLIVPPHSPDSSPTLAHTLKDAFSSILPSILDKLSDSKLSTRELATQSFVSAARANLRIGIHSSSSSSSTTSEPPIWSLIENGIKDHGFHSKNAKAREQALLALVSIRSPPPQDPYPLPPLRPFTPLLLPLLSDPDPSVRSTALSTTIEIFSSPLVNTAAKTDLKKAMIKLDLPKKVQDQVLQSVLGGGGGGIERTPSSRTSSSTTTSPPGSTIVPPPVVASGPATRTRTRAALSSSTSTTPSATPSLSSLPASAFPSDPSSVHAPSSTTTLEPVYLTSIEDLQREIERMKPCFEGKETEHNWIERDKSIALLRGMIEGGVCKEEGGEGVGEGMREEFVRCVKEVHEGIIKTSSSLRTTLAISALTFLNSLILSLPRHLVDQLLDPFLTHCLSMSSQTKKLVATASQVTVGHFLERSNYHSRITQSLVSGIINEKVVSSRQFYATHLETLIKTHGGNESVVRLMDQIGGGTDELIKGIKKGLEDPNAGVRENSRKAYWCFERVWKERAEGEIRDGLDTQAKKLLDKVRPVEGGGTGGKVETEFMNGGIRKPVRTVATRAGGGGGPTASSAGSAKKPSVRELMLAAKKKKLEDEVAEAQAQAQSESQDVVETLTLTKPSTTRSTAEPSTPTQPLSRPRADSSSSSQGSLTQQTRDSEADDSQLLQDIESPFGAPTTLPSSAQVPYETPSRPSKPSLPIPTNSSNNRPRRETPRASEPASQRTPVKLPVLEPVVDESLRDQAMQAEQTAQRLLEIAQEESEDDPSTLLNRDRAITPRPLEKTLNGGGGANIQQTPLNGGKVLFGRKGGFNDVFQDSPDPRDGAGGGGEGTWWTRKAETAELPSDPVPVDSEARKEELDSLVSSMQSLDIDTNDLKKVLVISRERPVKDDDDEAESAKWWREGKRFEKVYEGVRKQLLALEQDDVSRGMALIVLRDLVENQFPCFAGDEAGVFELLLELREDPSRTTIAATETIATSFTSRLEPLYGLGVLCPSLRTYLESTSKPRDATARPFALALKLVGIFFEGLPAEVLEDVFPQSRDLIKKALNDQTSGDLRRAAINALVSAQSVLRDEKRLTEMMDGLAPDQANLLSYYCAKRGV